MRKREKFENYFESLEARQGGKREYTKVSLASN